MKIKRIFVYLLVFLLIVKCPIIAYAESAPGTVTVEGGSIGSGGVEGNSSILKGTALTILMTTLASLGVQVKLSAEDYEHGNSAFNYLEDKFNEWESNAQIGWDAYEALNNTKVGNDGELYLDESGSDIIQKFINWLKSNNYINLFSGGVVANYIEVPEFEIGSITWSRDGTNLKMFQIFFNNLYQGCTYDTGWFQLKNKYYSNISYYSARNLGNGIYALDLGGSATPFEGLPLYETTASNINDAMKNVILGFGETPDVTFDDTGLYAETLDIPQIIDENGDGKILTVQPGLIGQVQDAYTGSNNATIGIQDYLDALRDLYGQQALPQDITDLPDITIPGEDAITGTREDVAAIDREIALNPDITLPADSDAITWPEVPDIAVAVADPSVPSDPDVSIPAMSLDLTQYFPFCLPFDIYHILQKLNADPVTPEVTIDWGDILGSFGIEYVMNLDLHDYDNLAELLRNMETAAFVVGLAVVTRQMFLRG